MWASPWAQRASRCCFLGAALWALAPWAAAAPVMSDDTRQAWQWVRGANDNGGLPYAIVDKRDANIVVFDADGNHLATSTVLLGQAIGDQSIPDIALRDVTQLRVEERITPAGRFDSQPGHNHKGEDIVWVDYAAAVAIHRLRPADPRQRRPERLASDRAAVKRISLGCVVVPVAFYDQFVKPLLGRTRGVVYVLPEAGSVRAMFDAVTARPPASLAAAVPDGF